MKKVRYNTYNVQKSGTSVSRKGKRFISTSAMVIAILFVMIGLWIASNAKKQSNKTRKPPKPPVDESNTGRLQVYYN